MKGCQTPWTNPDFGMLVGKGRGLPDGKHDWTFEIEGCQTKNTTGFLKLRYCQTNYEPDFGRKTNHTNWTLGERSNRYCRMNHESDFGRKISILPDESYELDFGLKVLA
ncbi:hypothetical protein RclHR1_12950003 [Rhizophagus clarus]|uniref:Uncharacterized protein n=1 Tax=Rhizophagus clarus TaxID=94130 RepID=A0A2Z6QDD3_9GLOM|nr:hypothetical protein RclHR1_12950003 [Rhizophagus clarus]